MLKFIIFVRVEHISNIETFSKQISQFTWVTKGLLIYPETHHKYNFGKKAHLFALFSTCRLCYSMLKVAMSIDEYVFFTMYGFQGLKIAK